MAVQNRTRKTSTAKSPKSQATKVCKICQKNKNINEFYKVDSPLYPDGTMDICSDCIKESVDPNDIDEVINILRQMNKPFVKDVWESSVEESSKLKTKPHPLGRYMGKINSLKQYREMTFKDSKDNLSVVDVYDNELNEIELDNGETLKFSTKLAVKWGENYTQLEILRLEKYYLDMISHFKIETPNDISQLKQLAKIDIALDRAMGEGDFNTHKDLVASQDKLMKSAGFTAKDRRDAVEETGLGSFGEVWAEIEREEGFIPPKLVDYEPDDIDDMLLYYTQGIMRFTDHPVPNELEDPNWREVAQEFREDYGDYDVISRPQVGDENDGV